MFNQIENIDLKRPEMLISGPDYLVLATYDEHGLHIVTEPTYPRNPFE